jgi:hypothetical protein
LLTVGLADLRGALHFGVDEASWLGTAFNAGLMFIEPFSVYIGLPAVRQQAFRLAITDSFRLVAWAAVCCLIVVACMAPVTTQYRQVVKAAAATA